MPIKITCPNGHMLHVKDEFAGKSGTCPQCRARIQVPLPGPVSEDDIISILGDPRSKSPATAVAAPPAKPAVQISQQDKSSAQPQEKDAARTPAAIPVEAPKVRRKRVCPTCCEIVDLAYKTCPLCGMALSDWTFPEPEEKSAAVSKPTCLHLGVRKQGDVLVIRFGEHRILNDAALRMIGSELTTVVDRPDCRNLLLNFKNVDGLSSLMLGVLLMLRKKIEAKQGKMKLCEVAPAILEVFTVTKLGQLFHVLDNEQQGLKAFA